MKLREAFEAWIKVRESVASPQSITIYRYQAEDFLCYAKERKVNEPEQVTAELVAGWMNMRLRSHQDNPNYLTSRMVRIRGFLKWCRETGLMTGDATKGLPKIQPADIVKVPFTWSDFQLVMDAAAGCQRRARNGRWHNWPHACILAWHTGMRFSDCALLKWSQCDLLGDTLIVQPYKMRFRRLEIVVPIDPDLRAHLLEVPRTEEIWVDPPFRWEYLARRRELLNEFRAICDSVGLHRHTFHSFRHGFVTRLINSGCDAVTISSMTGQSIEVIQGYAHVSAEAKRAALARCRHEPTENEQAA